MPGEPVYPCGFWVPDAAYAAGSSGSGRCRPHSAESWISSNVCRSSSMVWNVRPHLQGLLNRADQPLGTAIVLLGSDAGRRAVNPKDRRQYRCCARRFRSCADPENERGVYSAQQYRAPPLCEAPPRGRTADPIHNGRQCPPLHAFKKNRSISPPLGLRSADNDDRYAAVQSNRSGWPSGRVRRSHSLSRLIIRTGKLETYAISKSRRDCRNLLICRLADF
jgi:hypothetical protein